MYFASVKEITIHNKAVHKLETWIGRNNYLNYVKDKDGLLQDTNELLCTLELQELEGVAFDDAEVKRLDLPNFQSEKSGTLLEEQKTSWTEESD